jgi:hypothetical protein
MATAARSEPVIDGDFLNLANGSSILIISFLDDCNDVTDLSTALLRRELASDTNLISDDNWGRDNLCNLFILY